jgi:peptidyl-tRNA hydrolase, PTH1 family
VFGLGNPGQKYTLSRHNVGFDTVDGVAAFLHFKLRKRCFRLYRQAVVCMSSGSEVTFVEPLTYMNRSGDIARYFLPKPFTVDELIVVCDNLDLPPGMIRIRKGGSTAGNNGLKSLVEALDCGDFIRVYVGIGRPTLPTTVVDHVLGRPTGLQESQELQAGVALAVDAVMALCDGRPLDEVMRAYNRKNSS